MLKLKDSAIIILCSSLLIPYSYGKADDAVDGGTILVYGTLTESTCHLVMDSATQLIALGNIDAKELVSVGDIGTPVKVNIKLTGCRYNGKNNHDEQTGNRAWSNDSPSVAVRFIAAVDQSNPRLFGVMGATGFGLQISDDIGRKVEPNARSRLQFLYPEQDSLTYTVEPVRTKASLVGGVWQAIINFGLEYD